MKKLLSIAPTIGLVLAALFFMPWNKIKWGQIEITSPQLVTVTGYATSQQKSQIARFSAGVSSVQDDKQQAIDEVNNKVSQLIEAIKNFGIEDEDIQTQSLSIYRNEEYYYDDGSQKSRPGQWRVSNSVEITLREVDNASKLAELLAQSGATNVYGPNFVMDDTKEAEEELLTDAIDNAQEKAEKIAKSGKRKLGKMVNVSESGASSSVIYGLSYKEGAGGGGGAPIEPGTETVSKTVTVTFELE